jgi:dCTP deaminase
MLLNDKDLITWHTIGLSNREPMIVPFVDHQVREEEDGLKVISYGLSSFGYDLRAGLVWDLFSPYGGSTYVDPKSPDPRHFYRQEVSPHEAIVLPPHTYALTSSLEYLRMPPDVEGICVGKSTYARCGIIVNVTPLEPGWEGNLTIEISNSTHLPVKIYAHEGICQLLFFKGASVPEVSYATRNGKYQGQRGITRALL